jgi:hypothetical protein
MTKANPDKLLERLQAMRAIRAPWETLWQEIANYVMPRRAPGLNGALSPSTAQETRLFDTTAVQANMTLANGCMAWMSPQESPWFAFDGGSDDVTMRWHSDATQRAQLALTRSNYYTSQHEFYLDRSAFGTACLYVEPGKKGVVNVQCWPVGSFCIDEDEEGNVDTVFREFELTVRQAVMKFGDAVASKVKERHAAGGVALGEKIKFLHAIHPRSDDEREAGKIDGVNMPIASVYLDIDNKHVCREGGYEEFPCMVSRYLEWSSGASGLYGWSPAWSALPEARQLNFLQKMQDALAEKMAFPPALVPEELEGEINASAGGITYFDKALAQSQAMPREWMTGGRYDAGIERVKERQAAINRAFHVELFQMFSQLDKNMTAREVAERANEKLIQFSPTFSRLTGELFNPLLARVFGIMYRGGHFAQLPDGYAEYQGAPDVQYSSRIALSLRSMHGIALQRTLEFVGAVAPLVPSVVKHFDWSAAARKTAADNGLPASLIRPLEDVQAEIAAEAEAAAQQQQMMMAMEAGRTMATAKGDSMLAQIDPQQLAA